MKKTIKFIILFILLFSCSDVTISNVSSYSDLTPNIIDGWIPSELLLKSLSDLMLYTELDTNKVAFKYKFDIIDLSILKENIRSASSKGIIHHKLFNYVKPQNLDTLELYKYKNTDLFIYIDINNTTMYGTN